MPRRKTRSSTPLLVLVIFAVLCCLGSAYYFAVIIPGQVTEMFGPADPSLSGTQAWQAAYRLYRVEAGLLEPLSAAGSETLFKIDTAESVASVAQRLQDGGLLASGEDFTAYLIYKGYDRALRSGEYYLSPAMTPVQIADKIHSSVGDRMEFGSIAGWRAEEVAASLQSYGLSFGPDQFLAAVQHPRDYPSIPADYSGFGSLEGFLFPGSYPIDRDITGDGLAAEMVKAFDDALTNKMKKGFDKNGLSLYQAVILASIVEKESILAEEKPIIASVFYNRLAAGMNLETDPTVQYALGYNQSAGTWWTNPLSSDDLYVASPYNTYQNNGLPPGPICNPNLDSLKAVAFPEQTGYYYFRAACDGSGKHRFAVSLDEHIQNACP